MGGVGDALIRGCTKLGHRSIRWRTGGDLEGSRADRPHCIYRGFCIQGCKVGAKASTLITHVPDAIDEWSRDSRELHGLAYSMWAHSRRVTGVTYFDPEGRERFQKAKAVIVAGYSIETPRLLLNSACPGFENGLGEFQRLRGPLSHGASR